MMARCSKRTAVIVGLVLSMVGGTVNSAAATEPGPVLHVSPASALFDVVLSPGQAESRLLTLTSASPEPLDIHLTAQLAQTSSPDHHFDDILIHTETSSTCEGVAPDPIGLVPLSRVTDTPQTTLGPLESQQLCVTAMVPAGVATKDAETVVHLVFNALQRPSDLATTGAHTPSLLVLVAIVCGVSGWFLYRRRRPSRHEPAAVQVDATDIESLR